MSYSTSAPRFRRDRPRGAHAKERRRGIRDLLLREITPLTFTPNHGCYARNSIRRHNYGRPWLWPFLGCSF